MSNVLHVVTCRLPKEAVETFAEFAAAHELDWTTVELPAAPDVEARVFAETAAAAVANRALILAELPGWLEPGQGLLAPPEVSTLAREDWAETWKQFFHTLRVSERLVIKPTWETYAAQPGDVVLELDPGMSFGTGRHGTTQACLEFLDQYSSGLEGQPFVDVGTGSGILAMAGRRLGLAPVMACDNDPQAAAIARENLARAGLGEVTVTAAGLEEWQPPVRGRIVAANILAPVLLEHAERLRGWLATTAPSYLLLSGILTEQYPAILERYQALGLRECARRTLDEWTSGCFVVLEPTADGTGF